MYDCSTIKYLYVHEKNALFRAIEKDPSIHRIRNMAIFQTAEYAALRASEIGMIRITDLNLTNVAGKEQIYFKRLKHSNNNTLRILDPNLLHILKTYLNYRECCGIDSDYLFPSQKGNPISRKTLDDLMKRYCRLANIPKEKAHFHVLKHTRAVELAELGLDTKEVQYWTGHKNIANTEIYLQFTTTQQETLYRKILANTVTSKELQPH